MPTRFRSYQPDQILLLPPALKDWLPEGHPAYFISETVERLNLKEFYQRYQGDGRRNSPYDPRMMVKLLLYGYAVGVFSSRKLARKIEEDVALRILAAGNFPAHRTLAEFRRVHLKEFQALFVQMIGIAREVGVLKLGTIAVDGTKVRANASKRKAMSYGRMKEEEKRLREEIEALTSRAEQEDGREDELYGEENRGDELPEELRKREKRLEKIGTAIERLKQRQAEEDRAKGRREEDGRQSGKGGKPFKREFGEPDEKAQTNFTDPESRIMKSSTEGYQQSYNAQVAVDETSQLIVAAGVTQNAADSGQLTEMVEGAETNTGKRPKEVLADAGYRDETTFQDLEGKKIEAYISLGREGKQLQKLPGEDKPASRRMCEKLKTATGQARYKRRKAIVEPVYGWVKEILGFRRFSVRGIENVRGEWALVCLAVNLKHLGALLRWL